MAQLYYTLNGQTIYPLLPIDIEDEVIGDVQQMADGSERLAYLATKRRWVIRHDDASESLRTTWLAAAPLTATYTLTDELGTSYTVRTESRRATLIASNAADNTTTYEIELNVRQV